MINLSKYCFIVALWFLPSLLFAQVIINEAVSKNSIHLDAEGDSPDWFELYNVGNTTISLENWSITDRFDQPGKWQFPELDLLPQAYIRIWASDKDQILGDEIHTNFKISAEGESLYLFDPAGDLQDDLEIPEELPIDHSIGIPLNGTEAKLFITTTPGSANPAAGLDGFIPDRLQFSHPGGLTDELSLTLSGAEPGEQIHYTLDASIPTIDDPIFVGPLSINSDQVIRAKIFREGYLPSPTQSKTFLINKTHELPVVTLVTEPENLFDSEMGIYAFGNSASPNFPYFGANFWNDWERPIHFTFYEPEGELGIDFNAGVKIFGGYSRGNAQRSLSIFARAKYGDKDIEYPFFPDLPYEEFEALTLRNSGNDWLNSNIRDPMLTSLMQDADLEYSDHRPVVAYINGEYWGMYHLREKINEHFLASKKDVEADELTILDREGIELQGSNGEYLSLYNFVKTNDLSNPENYQEVIAQIDVDNFILYQLTQIYINNTDWPGNNIKYWKSEGGKWRWIFFDTDFAFGTWGDEDYNANSLAAAMATDGPGWPNPPWATLWLRKLCENPIFRNQFINRFADEMNSRFLPERILQHIDENLADILSERDAHFNRWDGSLSWHNERIEAMKNFAQFRPVRMKEHIRGKFGLPGFHTLTLQNDYPSKGTFQLNSLHISAANWSGDYFEQVPVSITAIPAPGYTFDRWSGASISVDPNLVLDVNKAMTLRPIFKEIGEDNISLIINEINYQSPAGKNAGDWIELHNRGSEFVNLTNFVLKDSDEDNAFIFPEGTVIGGNGYLVLINDLDKFTAIHPTVDGVVGEFDFDLSSDGDAVRIFNPSGKLKDEVYYLPIAPWPTGANGEGPSLELISGLSDNSQAENWDTLHPLGSPGQPNVNEIIQIPTGIDIYNVAAFPNPFSDNINLNFSIARETELEATLYDASGKMVRKLFQDHLSPGDYQLNTPFPNLSPGIYFLQLNLSEQEAITIKWLKE